MKTKEEIRKALADFIPKTVILEMQSICSYACHAKGFNQALEWVLSDEIGD